LDLPGSTVISRTRLRYFLHRARALGHRNALGWKQFCELDFWRRELDSYVEWHEGRLDHLWGVPSPPEQARVRGPDPRRNAVMAWIQTIVDEGYPSHLFLPRDYFRGERILDVGCGPIPLALGFADCEVYGLDQLVSEYRTLGFPMDAYPAGGRMTYVEAGAEAMPFEDDFFDAVISVNAIDHVDDLGATAREIARVLRPGGTIRIEAHYHAPTVMEPWSIGDDDIVHHFGGLGVRKVRERPVAELPLIYPGTPDKTEKLVVWANRD